MTEFTIEFKNVPAKVQDAIWAELKALNPEEDCIVDNSFLITLIDNGKYKLSCKKRGGSGNRTLHLDPIDETEPAAIARTLRKLTNCW
jgi:hypothetical protein